MYTLTEHRTSLPYRVSLIKRNGSDKVEKNDKIFCLLTDGKYSHVCDSSFTKLLT
jgi:hypothetical protein